MLRLGNGEYESAIEGRDPPSAHHARDVFLMTLSEMLPEVLRDLERSSLEYYRKSGLHFDDAAHQERLKHLNQYDRIREMTRLQQHHRWSSPEWNNFEEEEITYDQNLSALQKSIFQWSRKWRLDASWCRERAFHTLDYWCSYPDSHKRLAWNYEPVWETVVAFRQGEHPRFRFEYKTLYPREGHRSRLEQRITEAFRRELKAFLDSREQIAKEAGMKPVPKKREKSHFEWLICFQVKGMSPKEILAHYEPHVYEGAIGRGSLSEYTKRIRKAVNEVSRLIGLPLRIDGIAPGRRRTKR
jgi:hypothetical protein